MGWLPTAGGGADEARLTADLNAEMIEHLDRFRRVRDRSIFIGDPDDIVPARFGPGLPLDKGMGPSGTRLAGYVAGFDVAAAPARPAGRRHWWWSQQPGGRRRPARAGRRGVPGRRRLVLSGCDLIVTGPRIEPGQPARRRGPGDPRTPAGPPGPDGRRPTWPWYRAA